MPFFLKTRASARVLTLASTLISGTVFNANAQSSEGNYYFFGDSATGQGNWSAIVGERGEDHSPYSSNNGFQRESNGLIWAEMLGRDVDIISDPDRDSSNINFAISGAHMTQGGDLQEFGIDTGVQIQTHFFKSLVDNGDLTVGNKDVFFVLAGGNDFLDRLEIDDPALEIQEDVINATLANVETLIEAGAKTIILSEVQPIQYAPEFADDAESRAIMSALMADTNASIASAISHLDIPDDVNIVTQKYTDMVSYIVSNAEKLGFSNVNTPCYDDENGTICASDTEGQNKYLFLDDLHFTEAGHAIEAKWWQATLSGANGDASLQTGRMPRIVQYQIETFQRDIKPGQLLSFNKKFSAYARPIYGAAKLEGQGDSPRTNLTQDGAILGMEGRVFDNLIVGAALSIGDMTSKFADGGRYEVKGGGFSLYAATEAFNSVLSVKATKGGHEIEGISRPTGVPFLYSDGETEAQFWHLEIAARKNFDFDVIELNTGLIASMADISVDGYTETGADGLNLQFENQSLDTHSLALEFGTKGPKANLFEGNFTVRPFGQITYTRQLGDDTYNVQSQLIDNTANRVSRSLQAAREDHFNFNIGLEAEIAKRLVVEARYTVNEASDLEDDDSGSISLRFAF